MSPIRFGCQLYTWQMSGDRYVGKLPHILQVVQDAGLSGIEPETCMLGSYYDDPLALQGALDERGLQLGALTLVCEWAKPTETEAERMVEEESAAAEVDPDGATMRNGMYLWETAGLGDSGLGD